MNLKLDADEIRRLRMTRALSQPDLANLAGVNAKTINRAELGGALRLSSVRKIAKALKVAPADIAQVVG